MAATRAQKIRLGVFLIVTTFIIIATLFYLVGASILEVRDEYYVILQGGSGGLEAGSQVRLNDIVVGRVESVRLDPDDPSIVRVTISLDHGTPVTVDTVATPEMANITGTKRLAMHGGTKNSVRLKPGDEIKAVDSDLTMITTKVVNISNQIEQLLDNLNSLTKTENVTNVSNVIAEVEGITKKVNMLLDDNHQNINSMITDAQQIVAQLHGSMDKVDHALDTIDRTVQTVASSRNVKNVSSILDSARVLASNISTRSSDEELGQTIQSINRLVSDANVFILRLRTDMQRVMRDLETSVENINEFTQILIDDPSVLISGRGEKDRQLP